MWEGEMSDGTGTDDVELINELFSDKKKHGKSKEMQVEHRFLPWGNLFIVPESIPRMLRPRCN